MQQSSLEALSTLDADLTNLPSADQWDNLCEGLTACLVSNNTQTLLQASTIIVSLSTEFSRLGDHACTAQLFSCIANATKEASSASASEAIWQACFPAVNALALNLPQTCVYYPEPLLASIVHALCKLLRFCMDQQHSPLQKSIVLGFGGRAPMAWWHACLARSKVAKVTACCNWYPMVCKLQFAAPKHTCGATDSILLG